MIRLAPLALAAVLVTACTSGGQASGPPPTSPATTSVESSTARPSTVDDWPTYHGNFARTGKAPSFPTPRTLRVVATVRLDAAVYASPIVAEGITVVPTENDSVYGLDANGRQLWRRNLGEPTRRSDLPCGNIDPSGITGTAVYADGVAYVVAEYRAPVRHELVALSIRDGTVRWRVSVDLPGADPAAMQERGALAIAGGRVWVPFGGRAGDCGNYKGRVVGVSLDGKGAPIAYTVPTPREGGIWAPPGVAVDADGHLLVAVGNGEHGQGDTYDYSDSVLQLGVDARLIDSFSPTTWGSDNEDDLDLGSQGPVLIGTKWVFIAGKSGTGYVLRQGHLGGVGAQVWQGPVCPAFGGAALDGDVVYVPCDDGIRAVRVDAAGTAHVLWHASPSIAGSPVLGGGRVWALDQEAGVLHALDPMTGHSTAQVDVGVTSRFATPALSGEHLLIPTLAGLTIVAAG
ncbi:MAG TPA: PQQ-binding-like beta-propeller repeat protein [Jatrophihabitantaceae bacterium]|jgi:outer membrane protein assembly factor BamB